MLNVARPLRGHRVVDESVIYFKAHKIAVYLELNVGWAELFLAADLTGDAHLLHVSGDTLLGYVLHSHVNCRAHVKHNRLNQSYINSLFATLVCGELFHASHIAKYTLSYFWQSIFAHACAIKRNVSRPLPDLSGVLV